MTLQEAKDNIGKKVIYTPFEGCDSKDLKYGVITSVNSKYVFVRYGSDINSKATGADYIELDV
jgi:hypothetical protein